MATWQGPTPGGKALRDAALRRMPGRDEIDGLILDTDIDGLLSGALLHTLYGWPVVGFYDTETLWLTEGYQVPLDLDRHLWVDVDMTWPGTRCLSQHVMADEPQSLSLLPNLDTTVNPSVLAGVTQQTYEHKYPFGTYQWLWWVLDKDVRRAELDPHLGAQRGQGLAWMPDGGYSSLYRYEHNCRDWALRRMPRSLMDVTFPRDVCAPIRHVRTTKKWLAEGGPAGAREWQGQTPRWASERDVPECLAGGDYRLQWSIRGSRPRQPLELAGGQFILDRVTGYYGWPRLQLPARLVPWAGRVREVAGARPRPASRDSSLLSFDGETVAVSAVANKRSSFRWTVPGGPTNDRGGNLGTVLGVSGSGLR